MKSPRPFEEIAEEILDEYNRKPDRWKVLTDFRGNFIVIGPDRTYRIKLRALGPNQSVGIGVEIDESFEKSVPEVEESPSFGYRPLSPRMITVFLSAGQSDDPGYRDSVFRKMLEPKPVPLNQIGLNRPPAILQGPIIAHPDLTLLSDSQKKLNSELEHEVDRLFRKRFPDRAGLYI